LVKITAVQLPDDGVLLATCVAELVAVLAGVVVLVGVNAAVPTEVLVA
jgi:hypothetical protein